MSPLALFLLLVVGPVAAGFAATYPCGAKNKDGTRCIRGRKGPMKRCQDHHAQGATPSDWFWLAGCAVGAVMFYLWRSFNPGPLVETLLT
ncbi:hypothetical protein AB1046_02905 [Promicromonospora sp. Populi]|uniref:hypothetical protein n=1 Tax=Promicromonospora sp. Populi TaxID=3239420 RepID=UPI0034E200BA